MPWDWQYGRPSLLPVFQHSEQTIPGANNAPFSTPPNRRSQRGDSPPLSILHEYYAQSLDGTTLRTNALYALSEISNIFCNALNQELNLIETQLKNSHEQTVGTYGDGHLLKSILDARLEKLYRIRNFTKNRRNSEWPVASGSREVNIAERSAAILLEKLISLAARTHC